MRNWTYKYHGHKDMMSLFEKEQDYVNAVFAQIIMRNYGVVVPPLRKHKIRFTNTSDT